jgi:hypothetical protein
MDLARAPLIMNLKQDLGVNHENCDHFAPPGATAVLSALLAAAGFVVYRGLTVGDAAAPASGYLATALGVIFSLVGFGLVALIFYGRRKGHDEPATLIRDPGTYLDDAPKTPTQGKRWACAERSHLEPAWPASQCSRWPPTRRVRSRRSSGPQ